MRGLRCEVVLAKPVVKDRLGVFGGRDGASLADFHQIQGRGEVSAPRREVQRYVRQRLGSDAEVKALGLLVKGRRQGRVSGLDMERREVVEGRRELDQLSRGARKVGLTQGQLEPCIVVPQV